MMRYFVILLFLTFLSMPGLAQNITIKAKQQSASTVFRTIMRQTGKNFVYDSDLLKDMKVTVNAQDAPLKKVLDDIFRDFAIDYKIKGKNVVLKRKKKKQPKKVKKGDSKSLPRLAISPDTVTPVMLEEVEVISRLEAPQVETAEIGARKVTGDEIRNTPVLFGEADVIKALTAEPGVTEGTEGMAGMNVHGGNTDENLYMIENVPLYQVNHFAGLFSAFNTDIIRYIDFFKSSMPAKYDGRLSSFLDVRTINGTMDRLHGSARLGLTSGAVNIWGPIGKNTTYVFGLRRSWYDLLTIPGLALINSLRDDGKTTFHYFFTDLNAKVTHRFSNNTTGFMNVYFGNDLLKIGYMEEYQNDANLYQLYSNIGYYYSYLLPPTHVVDKTEERYTLHWGNLLAQAGLNYSFSHGLSAEFTAAYTRFFTDFSYIYTNEIKAYRDDYLVPGSVIGGHDNMKISNNINDWIFRGDFDWQPDDTQRVRFGANYVRHSFLPQKNTRSGNSGDTQWELRESSWSYGANEVNLYIEDDWKSNGKFRVNAGFHLSLFGIEHTLKHGISPRLSAAYTPFQNVALKVSYSRTTQYVHQLSESYLALPTDRWIPIPGDFKPQTADKIALGAFWQSKGGDFAISLEGHMKWMHNIVDYCDEYYLRPPMEIWDARLTSGKGTSKGLDLKIEKKTGKITGHVAYSLAWADRTFAEKNGGVTFPARFDHRHSIKVLVNWDISKKVTLNAAWIGHSGNRYTFLTQSWEMPQSIRDGLYWEAPLKMPINYYRLPFYHRLDLACVVRNRRGYWTFSLYNAYNHMNAIAITRSEKTTFDYLQDEYGNSFYEINSKPVFKKVTILPLLPSISYTWQF